MSYAQALLGVIAPLFAAVLAANLAFTAVRSLVGIARRADERPW